MEKNIDLLQGWQRTGSKLAYPAPQGAKGVYRLGFVEHCDTAFDAMDYDGLALTVRTGQPNTNVTVTACLAQHEPLCQQVLLAGAGVHTLYLPLDSFPLERANRVAWQFLTGFEITGAALCAATLHRARSVAVVCPVAGRCAPAGGWVSYRATVANCTGRTVALQAVQLFEGWESACATVTPAAFTLEPDGEQEVEITLELSPRMVPGGRETTRLRFTADGDGANAATLTLHTLCELPHPYLYHDKAGWQAVAEKIEKYPQFRPAFQSWQQAADAWEPMPPAAGTPYCYFTDVENLTMAAAYCYAITGERKYAEKLAQFFRYFTDAENGYPARLRGCHQSYVQEGHFFQHLAIPYDIIHDAGVLTEADHAAIAHSFRLYMALLDKDIRRGRISNWVLSEVTGALYCALALQDWALAERFVYGPCGTVEQLTCGAFSDGWWHECSIGYNTWVASMLLHTAHALRPFGVDLVYAAFPLNYSAEVSSTYACQATAPPSAMVNQKWGANRRNALHIKDLFDAILPFLDWRGVMFGVNDSDEKTIEGVHFGSTYDLAYHYYQNPDYLPVIRRFAEQDPIFGHGELPLAENKASARCAFADNIGLALLRSQTPGRAQAGQIQAVLRYGSHGGAHGHFDIGDLLCIMRQGRSLFNPEHSWWGYRHFMYKWHVQNSLTKNMVNVDDKMQLPAESRRILFYTGQALQAAAVESHCRWAYPPYGGMDYDDSPGDFAKRLTMNVAWFPIDPSLPYAQTSAETEPIAQRRLVAVTDDYLVVFDWAKGEQPHQYETTWQLKGLRQLTAPSLNHRGHTAQYTTNPASDGQMITDCHWYDATGTVTARFCNEFTAGAPLVGDRSSHNEPGALNLNLYTAWPPRTTVVEGLTATYIGWPADKGGYNIPLRWAVVADGKTCRQGGFDGWILGKGEVDMEVTGCRTLTLQVEQDDVTNEKGQPVTTPQGVFWGSAVLTLADGSTAALASLPFTAANADPGFGSGKDYAGGRVLIMGEEYPNALPTSPQDHAKPATLTWDLSGLAAVRLQAVVGVDPYPGSEEQRRHFLALRAGQATQARFTTVLEPYEGSARVQEVRGESADTVTVTLTDGRVQRLTLTGMEDETAAPTLTLEEWREDRPLRRETAQGNP